jgi:hypothetical protein
MEIFQFIEEKRRGGLNSEEIHKLLSEKYPKLAKNFNFFSTMDDLIDKETKCRHYWRSAYNFPNNGSVVNYLCREHQEHELQAVAYNCGLFTFMYDKESCPEGSEEEK